MTKADIVSSIAETTGLTKKEVATVVNQFFAEPFCAGTADDVLLTLRRVAAFSTGQT